MDGKTGQTPRSSRPDLFGDAFTTLLYGAVISLLISSGAPSDFTPLFLILFVLSDWMSRVWLPWRLPEDGEKD